MLPFAELRMKIKEAGAKKVAVAMADDEDVLAAILHAAKEEIALPLLIGNRHQITKIASELGDDLSNCELREAQAPEEAAAIAVSLVRDGYADALMKGRISTSTILKAVLNRESGIRTGRLLSHFAVFYSELQDRFLFISDAAISIAPNVDQKEQIIQNAVEAMHLLGYEKPKVGCICALEQVNPAMQATLDAEELVRRNKSGQIKGCVVSGPFALDNALSRESAQLKGVPWANAGDIEFLLMPQIEAGNVLYKAATVMMGLDGAGIVLGARAPIILTSRADSEASKFNSIVLALYLAMKQKEQL